MTPGQPAMQFQVSLDSANPGFPALTSSMFRTPLIPLSSLAPKIRRSHTSHESSLRASAWRSDVHFSPRLSCSLAPTFQRHGKEREFYLLQDSE